MEQFTRTALATAFMCAMAVSSHAAAPTFTWSGATYTAPDEVVVVNASAVSGEYDPFTVTAAATGTAENFKMDVTLKNDNNSLPQLYTVDVRGSVTFAGSSFDLTASTDVGGTGNNAVVGLWSHSANTITLSAANATINAVSTHADGKSIYAIYHSSGTLDIQSQVLNVSYETHTNRKPENQYSEAMGIDVANGALVKVSEQTVLNIMGSSFGEDTATLTNGSNAGAGNYYGAGTAYGVKLEGGQIQAMGTTNVKLDAVGAHTAGLLISNFFKNTTNGSVWGKSAAVFNDVNIDAKTKNGDVFGIETSFTPKEDQKYDVILETLGTTTLTVASESGNAYGVYNDAETTIQFDGDLHASASSTSGESYALYNKNGILNIQGANNTLNGNVSAVEGGVITFGKAVATFAATDSVETNTVINGNVASDGASKIIFNNAAVEIAEGNTVDVKGELTSTNGQLVLNDVGEGTVQIATLTEGSTLDAVASGNLNDKLGGDLDAFNSAISITNGAEGTTLVMKEGLVAGEKTAQLTEEGKIDETTVTEKTNSVMASSLEMAAAMPLAMNRILTNDVRKRMGDLRASKAASGAWARYDGGKLSGDSGLDSEFHTIQVGVDTVATPDAPRVGLAFSYTDGDMDYARSSSDMQGYSLAGYATWMADNGMFLDTVVRMAKFKNDMTVDGRLNGTMDSLAVSVSGETGWRFDLNDLFYVEPQAEVAYTYLNGDSFTLGEASYKVDGLDSLTGRLGFASGLKCPNNKGDVYLRASVVHEFLGDSKITGTASGSTGVVELDGKDTWVEYGLGANFNITETTYVWADVERTAGSVLDTDWRATVGVRHSF